MGPIYPALLADRFGMREAVEAVRASDGVALPAAAGRLADEVTLFGTYEDAAERVAAWRAAGADSVSFVLPPGRPEEELRRLVDVAASVGAVAR